MSRWRGGLVFGVPVILLTLGSLFMLKPWSGSAEPLPTAPGAPLAVRDGFAADRVPSTPAVPFDAARAMGYLEAVCKIGTRVSGSPGMKQQQDLLVKHFQTLGGAVTYQRFTARQESKPNEPVEMANLIVSWHPERPRRVILCSHYDSRPIADQEPDRTRWAEPFLSANDGASGVALLMELAHHMKSLETNVGVDFVLFDGEEYIYDPAPGRDRYFFGSEHFAREYRASKPKHRYIAALLFDMIGGKNARFLIEQNSWLQAGRLVESVWGVAAQLQIESFRQQQGHDVRDDHIALNRVGIPAIDIIDFDYPHWHRLSDVPANCAGESLGEVGRVVSSWLQQIP